MTTHLESRHWLLARRPDGALGAADLERCTRPVPAPADEQVLVQVLYAAMDPAIRGFMNASGNYAAAIALGEPVRGMVLGRVIGSRSEALAEGQIVFGFGSWSDYVVAPATHFHAVAPAAAHELTAYTHVLGTSGLTAYYGLIDIAALAPGDAVLVSAATGAVGSLAGQIARRKGAARVVGIAGGAAKCRTAVERYGYDQCIDYKTVPNLAEAIGAALPRGIDVNFENVGGAVLEAALDNLAKNARIALCGMISGYNATATQRGPANLWNLIVKTAQIRAFRTTDIFDQPARTARMLAEISAWITQGKLNYDIDVREGFDAIPGAFGCLFTGAHAGRLIVKIADA